MKNYSFNRVFARRTTVSFGIIILLFLCTVLRLSSISTRDYAEVQVRQSTKRITVSKARGTVFDRNMYPITNNEKKLIAAVLPTERAAVCISAMLEGDERDAVLKRLREGTPVVCEVPYDPECSGITVTTIYEANSSQTPAVHIVGYTDSEGHGISGIELAYDSLLYTDKTVDALFTTDGKGGVLNGTKPQFENASAARGNGVITTLDINIQNITETACEGLIKGAAVVCEISSGKIRAIHSRPTFDITDISASLENPDSPLLDRSLAAFSVGSVFKPCVAAAALESGVFIDTCTCTGSIGIENLVFNCHARAGHGAVDLKSAIAQSCNSYFYRLSMSTGGQAICRMAGLLGFGSATVLSSKIKTSSGNMPKANTLTTGADLANIGIGQGQLLLSPVSMLPLYCAIANDGYYYAPTLIEGTVTDGKITKSTTQNPTKAMSENTAATLRECLFEVIKCGTGGAAAPSLCNAAGKTATAQTGRFLGGKEITNSWFCGYFPAEAPKYAVIVMSDGETPKSTASIFAEIADGICRLENINMND